MISISSFEKEDLKFVEIIQQDVKTKAFMQGFLLPHSKESIEEWFTHIRNPGRFPTGLYWAIRMNKKFAGYCCLLQIDWISKNAQVGIVVNEPGKGIGIQALKLIEETAFLKLDISKLYAKVIEKNFPAIRLFEKGGYNVEAVLKRDYFFNGELVDNIIYSKFSSQR